MQRFYAYLLVLKYFSVLKKAANTVGSTTTYNQGNQLTSDKEYQYEYDKNGNLTKKTEKDDEGETETTTYSYDYENRLIKVIKQESSETKTVSFIYDPFGRRIRKTVEDKEDGKTETKIYDYVYDNEDVVLEYGEKDKPVRYVHGPGIDEPLAVEQKGNIYYYHADGLGSIVALTDQKQKSVESYTYTSFGEVKRKGDKVKNTFTYTGREWDEEMGLYYYRARYYDAKVGRFISFDPIVHPVNGPPKVSSCSGSSSNTTFESLKDNPQKLNPFIYVENRPTILTDHFGLISISCEEQARLTFVGCSGGVIIGYFKCLQFCVTTFTHPALLAACAGGCSAIKIQTLIFCAYKYKQDINKCKL